MATVLSYNKQHGSKVAERQLIMKALKYLVTLCALLLLAANAQAQTNGKPSVANPKLRRELLKRLDRDQTIRNEWIKKGAQKPDEALMKRMRDIDSSNAARMRQIIKRYGWPGPEMVGQDGTEAAFLLVQHADYQLQKEMLPFVRDAYRAGKLEGQDYALLLDRVPTARAKEVCLQLSLS